MAEWINYNGKILPADSPLVGADNRGLRYGDGLFETMRMINGEIPLFSLHMDRLFTGLQTLQFDVPIHFTEEELRNKITALANKNATQKLARIRLMVFRGSGGLYDARDYRPNYVIEASTLPEHYLLLNENGLKIDVFPDARKSCDLFANLKTNNYLPYAMAALYAKSNQLNDCLLLNQHQRICDSTIANIFWINNSVIYTSPLSEGCVAGTMRKFILESVRNYQLVEAPLTIHILENADEVFLTNASYGIRWVSNFRDTVYKNVIVPKIYQELYQTNPVQ